jgi:hypothetical protein
MLDCAQIYKVYKNKAGPFRTTAKQKYPYFSLSKRTSEMQGTIRVAQSTAS